MTQPLPEPSHVPETPSPLWFWVEEDLEALQKQVENLRKKVKGLEGKVMALEQMLRPE
ncbi:MAG: hypothetical protein V3U52_04255 [Thermoplasmata archaeon]